MKVEKSTTFQPVTITLESQEEVDKIYSIFNYIIISQALHLEEWVRKLRPFKSSESDKYHQIITDSL